MLAAEREIDIRAQQADAEAILEHLRICDRLFKPPLSSRVCLTDYAKKLHKLATTFEAWSQERLIGLVAVYIDEQRGRAFVSNVSVVKRFQSMGLGRLLMEACHRALLEKHCIRIELDVFHRHHSVIQFYERLGYTVSESDGNNVRMSRFLEKKA